jgi:hypothetical protein
MLLAKHFGVASACLGQVEQERQKPGHRGRHRLNQIIYGVRFRRCWAFYDRIDVAMHCLTGFSISSSLLTKLCRSCSFSSPGRSTRPLSARYDRMRARFEHCREELEMKIFLTALSFVFFSSVVLTTTALAGVMDGKGNCGGGQCTDTGVPCPANCKGGFR